MNKAREKVQELLNEQTEDSELMEELRIKHAEKLKPDINMLLHQYLPDHITIAQAEILGVVIENMIANPEFYLEN